MSRTYTVPEVSDILGVPVSTLYEQVREGRAEYLHPIRAGRNVRIPRVVVDRLVDPEAAA